VRALRPAGSAIADSTDGARSRSRRLAGSRRYCTRKRKWALRNAHTQLIIPDIVQKRHTMAGAARPVPRTARRTLGSTVRVGPLAAIPELLRDLGCDPGPIVRAAGFELAFFDDPELPVPYRAGSALLARCVVATGCEHFGLMLGERAGPSSLGLAGFLMMNAPDVGRALEDLVHYLSLHDRGGVASFEADEGTALLGFTVIEPATQAVDQICDLSMAVARNLMRGLCGPKWIPSQVLLPRQPPADPTPWTRVFHSPVQFNAGQCAMAFPSRWLAHPVAVADPLLHRHLKQQADALHRDSDFASEVRRLVSGTIAHRTSTAAHVAKLLGMHEKTLNRRLLEAGLTFRTVRDDVRYAMAQQLLANTSMNVTGVAASLGYAEASAFVRAFARWAGTTPGLWRSGVRGRPRKGDAR
jgi:AraC-like DNA-binding protein